MQSFDKYIELLKKVDMFTASVVTAYQGQISCGPGCDDCCRLTFTVFSVEAKNLRAGFDLLPQTRKDAILRRVAEHTEHSPCVLLEDGMCALYHYRPVICRTHGLPFTSEHIKVGGLNTMTLCEKNFKDDPDLAGVSEEHVLNLDVLNTTLAAINAFYMKETGQGPGQERVWTHNIFAAATAA